MSWEALPARKRNRKNTHMKVVDLTMRDQIDSTREQQIDLNMREQIDINIQSRCDLKRANATLEGKDGCSGEFYEYLDHTADVQFHTWGDSLDLAFTHMASCMFNYITDISKLDIDFDKTTDISVEGHDLHSLLFSYMDELLFRFCTEGFCCVKVDIKKFDRENFNIDFLAYGCQFDPKLHPQGTEIKAITYSNMQIHETQSRADIYVIVDI